MSFGFSVGDFLAVIELANKIRRDFVGAPKQFQDISMEYALLATFYKYNANHDWFLGLGIWTTLFKMSTFSSLKMTQ